MTVSDLKTYQIFFFLFLLVKAESVSMREECYVPKLHFFFAFPTLICEKYTFWANFLIKKIVCTPNIYYTHFFVFVGQGKVVR